MSEIDFFKFNSSLPEEQVKEFQEQYFAEVSGLNKKIHELGCKMADQSREIERIKTEAKEAVKSAIACLDSVKAMLEYSNDSCATHRMKDFYAKAMIVYINKAKAKFEQVDFEPFPF